MIHSIRTNNFWNNSYSKKDLKQNIVLMILVDFCIFLIFFVNQYSRLDFKKYDMYSKSLVQALSKGEVFISNTPNTDKLDKLNDPYDTIEREKIDRTTDYIWDAAYFNGKYYVYFGALPAILIMVPYYLITKKLLQTSTVVLLFSLMSIPIIEMLTKKIFEKFFKKLPFKYMFASIIMMLIGTMLIWINVAPRYYELVIVAGFFFALLGFLLIFEIDLDNIKYKNVFLGCGSLALSVACRPTQIFSSLLIIPLLFKIIKVAKNKKSIVKILFSIIIPYLIIVILLMSYNYLRFNNPFEFGEKYQLTINNMKELSLRWILLPTGILCNLFGLPVFQANFPFIQTNANIIDTFSYYYVEDMPGGVFIFAPICFVIFGIFKFLKSCKNKDLKIFVTTLLIVGLIFVSFVSLKAGSTGRYLLDFSWLFVLCGIVIFMEIINNLQTNEGRKILEKVLNIIVCYTIIINLLSSFCIIGGINSIKNNSPKQYYETEYMIMFLK